MCPILEPDLLVDVHLSALAIEWDVLFAQRVVDFFACVDQSKVFFCTVLFPLIYFVKSSTGAHESSTSTTI